MWHVIPYPCRASLPQVFVLKFHTIARYQLVTIFKKCKPQSEMGVVDPVALPGVPATATPTPVPALPPPVPPTPALFSVLHLLCHGGEMNELQRGGARALVSLLRERER